MSDTRNMQVQDAEEDVIDLSELVGLLLHYAWLLIVVAIACGVAGFCFSRFVLPEQFESTTSIYILNRSSSDSTTYTTSELQAGTYLTNDYAELIVSRSVLEQVIAELGLDCDYEDLAGQVEVTTPSDTRIVSITVTDTDPRQAQTIANAVRSEAAATIEEVMGVEEVNVIDEANLPTKKSAPSNTRNAALAAILGFCLVAGFLIVRHLMDDTIKTSDDIERYLGLPTLAIIPLDMQMHIDDDDKLTKKGKRNKTKKKVSRGAASSVDSRRNQRYVEEIRREDERRASRNAQGGNKRQRPAGGANGDAAAARQRVKQDTAEFQRVPSPVAQDGWDDGFWEDDI